MGKSMGGEGRGWRGMKKRDIGERWERKVWAGTDEGWER